jgi:acyl-CoA thioesterase-1
MKSLHNFAFLISIVLFAGCSTENNKEIINTNPVVTLKYLALGDSYTIGQSVCETCRFPTQLKDSIQKSLLENTVMQSRVIALTGWTTSDLKSTLIQQNPTNDYDLVTLLIGVNNQYQNRPFSLYEQEFPDLLNRAITIAKGDKNNVIVVSIPDYAFTPFGQGFSNPQNISTQIDLYNLFAENYCVQNNITFVNITDITRQGLENPSLVAGDGLHPSKIAYSLFVERILPKVLIVLEQ